MPAWHSLDLHNATELLLFIFAREEWVSCIELGEDTSQTPHIDSHVVRHAKNNFRRTVETALDVGVYLLVLQTTASKVNDLDAGLCRVFEQNILYRRKYKEVRQFSPSFAFRTIS